MNRYWVGIGAGALAVFGVGMTAMALGKKGLHELKTAVAQPVVDAVQGPINALRFRLDGRRIGRLQSVHVESDGQWTSEAIGISVLLDDPAAETMLADCGIMGDGFQGPKDDARFRCVAATEVQEQGLVQIGQVRFEPVGLTRPLYVSARDRRQLERSDIRSLTANLSSSDGETVQGEARFDVETDRGRRQRGVVNIQAGDGSALIDIRDETGRRLFQLNANESGVSLNATDRRGRELVRLLAGEAGIRLHIDK